MGLSRLHHFFEKVSYILKRGTAWHQDGANTVQISETLQYKTKKNDSYCGSPILVKIQ